MVPCRRIAHTMKITVYYFLGLVASLTGLGTGNLQAQFYAPETRYHDIAQRHYVVELARVLAGQENLREPKIAEVTYSLTSAADGASKWQLKWLDGQGQPLREFTVEYPASLLLKGPGFYREILRQIAGEAKPAESLSEPELIAGYWKGAEAAGYTRMASLRAAFELEARQPRGAARNLAPALAGLLPEAALGSLADGVSLDRVLLARGAAWLAIAESLVKAPDQTRLDALWAPLMFLVGRENAAGALWKKAGGSHPSAMASCWENFFAQPQLADALVLAAQPQNRRFLLPVISYHCRREEIFLDLDNLLPRIFGEGQVLGLLHDHLPNAVRRGTVSSGHTLSNSAPFARQDWIECLRKFRPGTLDFTGYRTALGQQPTKLGAGDEDQEMCLQGFATAAPLIEIGHTEGTGNLIPVTTVTARDLLNYGWETTGLQIGARYGFVQRNWGVPERANAIAKAVQAKVSGLDLFFQPTAKDCNSEMLAGVDRLQEVDFIINFLSENPQWWKQTSAKYDEFTSRYWLLGAQSRMGCSAFYHATQQAKVLAYIDRVRAEGGPLCDGFLRQWFADDLRDDGLRRVPGGADYKRQFAIQQKAKEMDHLTVNMLWNDYEHQSGWDRGREFERAYWQGTCDDLYLLIYEAYIEAHAYASAKRFYQQAQPRIEAVVFSGSLGSRRFYLAWLENDQPAMATALRDSATGSYANMMVNIQAAAATDDGSAMATQIDECIQRYGKKPGLTFLKGFLPLLAALRDPASAEHTQALDYFAKQPDWIALQWILASRAKLSTEENIRFFGGPTASWERQFVVLALQKDKAAFQKKFDEHERTWRVTHQDWTATTLIHHLRNELLEIPVPPEQPDLKPPGALSLTEQVIRSLKGKP